MKKELQKCRCCNSNTYLVHVGTVINRKVSYYECASCDYVQTEMPYWLDQAYLDAINKSDTGIIARNYDNAKLVLVTLMMLGKLKGILVDFAGGYGILVRILRDIGINALWSDQYCQNLLAKGFEHRGEKAVLVSAFEVFEHFVNPAEELDKLLLIADNILLSTELIDYPTPSPDKWWYYGEEHGQHIGFFRIKTLEKLAANREKYLISNGSRYHLLTNKPVNQGIWKLLIRLKEFIHLIIKMTMVSKTWNDHKLMKNTSK